MKVETEEPEALEDLYEGCISLDRKLAAALTKIAKGEIGREITQYNTTALNNNRVVRGRVLLALVFQYYSSGASGQVLYDMNHLPNANLTWRQFGGGPQHVEYGVERTSHPTHK